MGRSEREGLRSASALRSSPHVERVGVERVGIARVGIARAGIARVGRWIGAVGLAAATGAASSGCGGAPEEPAHARADDPVYRVGLDRVLARASSAHERSVLKRSYDAGYSAGAEEALALDARSDLEARHLGCRAIYPVLEQTISRDGYEPPERDVLCHTRARADVETARHRGPRFDRTRDAVVEEAQLSEDRQLSFLLLKAHEYGYERGFRRYRGAWDEDAAARLERAGCHDAVDRAVRLGALLDIHRDPLDARCAALRSPPPSRERHPSSASASR